VCSDRINPTVNEGETNIDRAKLKYARKTAYEVITVDFELIKNRLLLKKDKNHTFERR